MLKGSRSRYVHAGQRARTTSDPSTQEASECLQAHTPSMYQGRNEANNEALASWLEPRNGTENGNKPKELPHGCLWHNFSAKGRTCKCCAPGTNKQHMRKRSAQRRKPPTQALMNGTIDRFLLPQRIRTEVGRWPATVLLALAGFAKASQAMPPKRAVKRRRSSVGRYVLHSSEALVSSRA